MQSINTRPPSFNTPTFNKAAAGYKTPSRFAGNIPGKNRPNND